MNGSQWLAGQLRKYIFDFESLLYNCVALQFQYLKIFTYKKLESETLDFISLRYQTD